MQQDESNMFVFVCVETLAMMLRMSQPPHSWAFSRCPAENECTNGHHSCTQNEDCSDVADGFQCDCKPGYTRSNQYVAPQPTSGGTRSLFLLGHKWGTITSEGHLGLGPSTGVLAPCMWAKAMLWWVLDGVAPPAKGVHGCHPGKFFENLLSEFCLLVP